MRPLLWGSSKTVAYVEKQLRSGRVVLAGGDTVLGLLAELSEKGYAKLDSIKNRSKKPYLILVENQQKALNLIEKDDSKICQIEKIMNVCWPGPVTLIFKAKATILPCIKSPEGNVAIRVPDHAGLLQLLERFDGLFSTSANCAGGPVPNSIEEVDESIMRSVVCVVLNDDNAESILPSTIIDCTGEKIIVVREGAFPTEKLISILSSE
ncbi:MAG TPA: L-threonylcarbamoyladenylate synthase [Candidatus Babeliales bacterium]|nr:L-threonylcarbamoyladenylate synthase [Candidatus Babeliales bacterium]